MNQFYAVPFVPTQNLGLEVRLEGSIVLKDLEQGKGPRRLVAGREPLEEHSLLLRRLRRLGLLAELGEKNYGPRNMCCKKFFVKKTAHSTSQVHFVIYGTFQMKGTSTSLRKGRGHLDLFTVEWDEDVCGGCSAVCVSLPKNCPYRVVLLLFPFVDFASEEDHERLRIRRQQTLLSSK